MKYVYSFVLIFLFISLNAQLTIDPSVLEFQISAEQSQHEYKIYVENSSNEDLEFYWMFETGEDFPADWSMFICDPNLCYLPGLYKCPDSNPVKITANGKVELKLTLMSKGVKGSSTLMLKLFDKPACEDLITTSDEGGVIQVGGTVDVAEVGENAPFIYPNPVSSELSITNDERVRSIEILDYNGKLMYKANHAIFKKHSINHIPSGSYIVYINQGDFGIKTEKLLKIE